MKKFLLIIGGLYLAGFAFFLFKNLSALKTLPPGQSPDYPRRVLQALLWPYSLWALAHWKD